MPVLLFFVLMLPLSLIALLIPASRRALRTALISPRQMHSKDSRHDR